MLYFTDPTARLGGRVSRADPCLAKPQLTFIEDMDFGLHLRVRPDLLVAPSIRLAPYAP